MSKSQIVIVARHPVGGIRTYFKYVYAHPAFDKFDFVLIAPDTQLADYVKDVFKGKSFEYVPIADSNKAMLEATWRVLKDRKPQLLHTHGFTSGLLSAPVARLLGIRHLMTAHDVILDWQYVGPLGRFKKHAIGLGFRLIDVLMAVGEDARLNLAQNYPYFSERPARLVAIRNGIDVARFESAQRRDLHGELGLDTDVILLGFFGRFMSQKGFRHLVNVVEILATTRPDLKLRVAAFGWGGFIREEQAYLKEKTLDHLFHFMPHTDDMPAAIRGVDAVVMPSLWEACPLLPMEALCAGVPVIASDCIGLKEVTEDTPAIRFKARDDADLVRAILKFLDERERCRTDAGAFVPEACRRFDAEASALGLRALYDRLL